MNLAVFQFPERRIINKIKIGPSDYDLLEVCNCPPIILEPGQKLILSVETDGREAKIPCEWMER